MDHRKHSAGKGDCPRKVDRKKWNEGWALAFPQRRKDMETFNEFRQSVQTTWRGVPIECNDCDELFLSNAINEEAGEIAGHVKKLFRDDGGRLVDTRRNSIMKEMGDLMYYLDRLAESIDTTLDEVAQLNYEKLRSREQRGTIQGDGDNR